MTIMFGADADDSVLSQSVEFSGIQMGVGVGIDPKVELFEFRTGDLTICRRRFGEKM
jgi:hypothetical protein